MLLGISVIVVGVFHYMFARRFLNAIEELTRFGISAGYYSGRTGSVSGT